MIRLAVAMLGDRAAAEDVVQDAFCALYRRFGLLAQPDRALAYVRSSVLNGCVRQVVGVLVGNRFVRIPRFPVVPNEWPIIAF